MPEPTRAEQLADAVESTVAASSEQELAAEVLQQAVDGCSAACGLVATVQGDTLRVVASDGPAGFVEQVGDRASRGDGALGRAAAGEVVACSSPSEHRKWFAGQEPWAPGEGTSIAVPIVAGGSVLGVLAVAWRAPGPVEPANRRLLAALATLTGQALYRAQLEESATVVDALYASDAVGVLFGEGDTIEDANDEFLRIVGRRRGDVEGGLSWRELTPSEQLLSGDRRVEAVRSGGGATLIKEYIHADGHVVPVLVTGCGLSVEPFRWFSMVLDLSDRERLHDLVETEATIITTLLESAPVGFAVLDRELRYLHVNESMAELNGLAVGDHRDRHIFDVLPSMRGDLEPLLSSVVEGGQPVRDVETFGATGGEHPSRRHGLASFFPVVNTAGSTTGVAMVVMDVSDRKRLEDELAATAQLLEAVVLSTPVGLALVDDQGCFVRLNEALSDLDPVEVPEHLGRRVEEIVPAPAGPALAGWIDTVLRTGEPVLSEELNGIDAAGAKVDAVVHVYPVRTDDDHISGAGIALIDVTERNRLARSVAAALEERIEAQGAVLDELQHLLLPQLSVPEGFEVDAQYRPAGSLDRVGGDWYDCFEHDGRVVLTVGDGVGHGLPAVRVMDAARNTIRALVIAGHDLAATMAHTNRVLFGTDVATAYLVAVDSATGELEFVLGGHLPPMLRRSDGTVEELSSPRGTILGASGTSTYSAGRANLAPGDTLVLYTDGLIERRSGTLDDSLRRLKDVLGQVDLSPPELAEHVLEQSLAQDSTVDDICLLIAKRSLPQRRS